MCAYKGFNAKPVWATATLVAMRNSGPSSNGVQKIVSTVRSVFECVRSTGVEVRAIVPSSVKHQNDVNGFGGHVYVVMCNKHLSI